jgi:phenylpyruvate tautomerase PptA (4-oxalocrotonate tautomerase family)
MPFVNVKTAGSLSLSQRQALAGAISQVLLEVAGKPPGVTYLQFEESDGNHWVRGDRTGAFSGLCFPFIEVKAAGALSHAQREGIAAGIEAAVSAVASPGNPPAYVVITEVPRTHWARGGAMLESP